MGIYIAILFIFFNLDVYLKIGMRSNCMGKDTKISIKLHKWVFSIEIIKVQLLYVEDVCNICSLYEIYHLIIFLKLF